MKLASVRPQTVEIEPGTVMNFWDPNEAATKKGKNKPALVLLHGFATDGILTWQFQVPFLTRKYAVYVPDFLFFGVSFTDRAERSPEFQAECLVKGLMKLGVERCIVVGFSYGGMVGFKMAELWPQLVESMVVSCSVLALTQSISRDGLERIGFSSWSDCRLPNSVKGENDKIFNTEIAHNLKEQLGDKAMLRLIDKAGHTSFNWSDPASTTGASRKFLPL
ncbi:hypothetical protein L1049_015161 [Liquidambar formosana]|uniref:AB hydrolase-1 domain-containing protein n=1 Tax=Liquidambar formosana TaxID=63359 RepID=A0AAP0S4A7_LIQFO